MGVEYMHISDQEQVDWIRACIEGVQRHHFIDEEKLCMLHGLVRASNWEKFIATKFPNEKRLCVHDQSSQLLPCPAPANLSRL